MKPFQQLKGDFQALKEARLPFLLFLVAATTVAACISGGLILGFSLTGWAWVIPFVLAGYLAFANSRRISLPLWLWLPWVCYILSFLLLTPHPHALQRTVMLLCPLVVGAALSTYRLTSGQLEAVHILVRAISLALWAIVLINTGMLFTGRLPAVSGLAPQAITACLLATFFASEYAQGFFGSLAWWASLAFIPVIALTRTAIAAAAVTLPANLARLGIRRRVIFLTGMLAVLVLVFYSPRMQQKMFRSGEGTLSDLNFTNPNLQTSGRTMMWNVFDAKIRQRPWFGYGANASEQLVNQLIPGLGHPHNDYIRLKYDYGYVGLCLFLLTVFAQGLHSWRASRRSRGTTRWLLVGSASAFLPFLVMMKTDNIILYAAFFGNLQFAMMGLGYAARAAELAGVSDERMPKAPTGRSLPNSAQAGTKRDEFARAKRPPLHRPAPRIAGRR